VTTFIAPYVIRLGNKITLEQKPEKGDMSSGGGIG
jgi:hypothetical protein